MDNTPQLPIIIPRTIFLPPAPELPIAVVEKKPDRRPLSAEDFTYCPHTHAFQELVVVLSGTGLQWISGEEFPVLRGDVFLLQGDIAHCFTSVNNLHLYNILFIPEELPLPTVYLQKISGYRQFFHAAPPSGRMERRRYGIHLSPEQIERMERRILALRGGLHEHHEGYEAKSLTLLLEIFIEISENYESILSGAEDPLSRIATVLEEMECNLNHDWNLADLADLVYTSPRNLLRLFVKATGMSPIKYLLQLRLIRSSEILLRGVSTIAETAQACGFHDANYFGKQFKKLYGVSPRKYCEDTEKYKNRKNENEFKR